MGEEHAMPVATERQFNANAYTAHPRRINTCHTLYRPIGANACASLLLHGVTKSADGALFSISLVSQKLWVDLCACVRGGEGTDVGSEKA